MNEQQAPNETIHYAASNITVVDLDAGNTVTIKHYDTPIVYWDDKIIKLNGGEKLTASSKRHMNRVAEFYDLRFTVTQDKYRWFAVIYTSERSKWKQFDADNTCTIYIDRDSKELTFTANTG